MYMQHEIRYGSTTLSSSLMPQLEEVLHPICHNRGPPSYPSQPILISILGAPVVQLPRVDVLARELPRALSLSLPSLKREERCRQVRGLYSKHLGTPYPFKEIVCSRDTNAVLSKKYGLRRLRYEPE